jgi:hypothetical protein
MGRRTARALLSAALALCLPSLAHAQNDDRAHALVVNPLSLAVGKASVAFQHKNVVAHAGCQTDYELFDVGYLGCEGSLSYRLIFAGSEEGYTLEGLYIAPLLGAGSAKRMVLGSSSGTASGVELGLEIGFQSISKGGLALNVNTGWRRRIATWGTADVLDYPRLYSPLGAAKWWPGIGVGIGMAF